MTLGWVDEETIRRIEAAAGASVSDLKAELLERPSESPIHKCIWLQRERGLDYADAKTLVAITCESSEAAE